jgi:hypothetical protein
MDFIKIDWVVKKNVSPINRTKISCMSAGRNEEIKRD